VAGAMKAKFFDWFIFGAFEGFCLMAAVLQMGSV
jgi:hypothetical protein